MKTTRINQQKKETVRGGAVTMNQGKAPTCRWPVQPRKEDHKIRRSWLLTTVGKSTLNSSTETLSSWTSMANLCPSNSRGTHRYRREAELSRVRRKGLDSWHPRVHAVAWSSGTSPLLLIMKWSSSQLCRRLRRNQKGSILSSDWWSKRRAGRKKSSFPTKSSSTRARTSRR